MTDVARINSLSVTGVIVDSECRPNPYVYGYGRRIPTPYRLQFDDGRTRRVYSMCYGNSGSVYVRMFGEEKFLTTHVEHMIEDAKAG